MKVRSSMLKRLGAIAFAAVLTAGILVPSVQQASAATTTKKYAVEKVSYSKNYKLDDGTTYFSVKGKFPTIKDDSEEAEKMNTALMKEKNRIIKSWKKQAAEVKQDYIDEVNAGYSSDVAFGDEIQCKITANNEKYFSEHGKEIKMNFYDKKVRRLISVIILVVILAMVATMVIPYLI